MGYDMSEHLKVKQMSMMELQEALERQNNLIQKHRSMIDKLKDKGAALFKTRDLLMSEIEHRKKLNSLESSMANLSIAMPSAVGTDNYAKKLCSIEKDSKERFKPFCTLRKTKDVKQDSPVLKTMDVGPLNTKPVQLLKLSDSIDLQAKQEERVKEGAFKNKQERLLLKAEQEEQEEVEVSHSEDENEDVESAESEDENEKHNE